MHSTMFLIPTLFFSLTTFTLAQDRDNDIDIDNDDIPNQCSAVCAPVLSLTSQCDRTNNDNDAAELNCVCTASNAASIIPACEACVAMYDNDGHDNDVYDILTDCSFTTTSFVASATSSVMGTVTSTSMASGSGSGAASTLTPTSTVAGASGGATQSTNAASPSPYTGAAAPLQTAGLGVAAVAGLACLVGL